VKKETKMQFSGRRGSCDCSGSRWERWVARIQPWKCARHYRRGFERGKLGAFLQAFEHPHERITQASAAALLGWRPMTPPWEHCRSS